MLRYIFIIYALISICLSCQHEEEKEDRILVGGYTRDSFAKNDARIDKAFRRVRAEILLNCGTEETCLVYPVALYSQLVNGINYRIIAGVKDTKALKVYLTDSVVYTGEFPLGANDYTLTYLTMMQEVQEHSPDARRKAGLIQAVQNYLEKTNTNANLLKSIGENLIILSFYPNLIFGDGFYIMKATDSSRTIEEYFIVKEIEGNFEVALAFEFN